MKKYIIAFEAKDDTLKFYGSGKLTSNDGDWFEDLDSAKKFVELKWANKNLNWTTGSNNREWKGDASLGTTYQSYTISEVC